MKHLVTALALSALTFSAVAADHAPVMDSKSCAAPVYPKPSLMNEETGTVLLGFLVSADGKVSESKIEKSSGFKGLDKAALNALSLCKFKPGTKDGKAETTWTKISFDWKLD
jgi:protein TonB